MDGSIAAISHGYEPCNPYRMFSQVKSLYVAVSYRNLDHLILRSS